MTQWKRDERPENVRTIGDFEIFSEVDKDEGTAHVVRCPDGQELRVLPDERSGRKRSNLVREAVEQVASVLEADTAISPQTYLFGLLLESGFTKWEWVTADLVFEEWLEDWTMNRLQSDTSPYAAMKLLHDLEADGWEITKGGGE